MKIYNTLTKKIETLQSSSDKPFRIFVCGPTVYDYSHLGHAKTYIQMDTLVRTLKHVGLNVTYLQNITDIDDKIIKRANEQGISWQALTTEFETAYKEDMAALGNNSVDIYARATDHIPDIINQVSALLTSGHAYEIEDDGIYFEIATFKDYGKLSGRKEIKENDAESRIDHSDSKRGWNDFCLWKFSKPNEPVWQAPFGAGRPGWHIEDTAISEHFFGQQYDMHGGAIDLIFPHHEAEITQMESISGKEPFVRYWVHSGFLNINTEKMSKSLGNFLTIRGVIDEGHHPMSIRLLMLQSHYRSSVDFSMENLANAWARLKSLQAMADLRYQITDDVSYNGPDFVQLREDFIAAISDDLNTPNALAVCSRAEAINYRVNKPTQQAFIDFLETVDQTLGLNLLSSKDISGEQKQLIAERMHAREAKDWPQSDALRDELSAQNILINDTPYGTLWYRD